ncbi:MULTISPECIES: DUF4238 domain-containing protein [unclassified Devosia]|uniref:DUF4238 domain-containing protein n=1 Tax=unclassified Devosia TaxID=196773 RepID=UPI001AC8AEC1|nr:MULTISPECIES: DUF4238 domain-containing protein [unclassified Devosia]MBN9306923.1 DUF4238 domain-containing protein [Devosia sp.]
MVKGKAPHRHHYVPRMVQRNFVNEDGGLYFWRREFAVGEVRSTTPANLFVEDNLYSMVDGAGVRDAEIEVGFSRLESVAAPFIDKLLRVVRHGMIPILDEGSWDFWHHYNYYAQKRVSAWHERFLTQDDLFMVMKSIATKEQWAEHERMWAENREEALRVMRNSRIAAQVDPPPEDLLAELHTRGLVIYVAPSRTSFILGDDVGASAQISTDRVNFMPIACDMAVGYSADKKSVRVERLTASGVRRMNEAMTKKSYLIAGRSRAQIASLSRISYEAPDILQGWQGRRQETA